MDNQSVNGLHFHMASLLHSFAPLEMFLSFLTFSSPSIAILDSTPIQLWFNIFFVALVPAVKRIMVSRVCFECYVTFFLGSNHSRDNHY